MAPKNRSQAELIGVLKTIPLFASCSQNDLRRIAAIVKQVEFAAGETICREGDTGVGLHVVLEGETKVQIGGRTRRKLGTGAFFGEIALLDGGPRSATVIAETPVKTLSIPSWSFTSVLKSQPALALKMLEETCRRLRTAGASYAQ
jgi:CRP-like cAMP-binding protein